MLIASVEIGESERELEAPRAPARLEREPPQPLAQVGSHRGDPVLPDARDGRAEPRALGLGHLVEERLELRAGLVEPRRHERQHPRGREPGEQTELDLVHERATGERIDGVDRLRHLARREPVDRLQEEAIRARREVLQRGRRVGPRPELVRLKPDVIFALGGDVAPFAQRATGTIPIVAWVSNDPVQSGLVSSVGRPGANITGLLLTSWNQKVTTSAFGA